MTPKLCAVLLCMALSVCQSFTIPKSSRSLRPALQLRAIKESESSKTKTNTGTDNSYEDIINDFFKSNAEPINDFCKGTNEFWKNLVIEPVRNYVEIQPAGTAESDVLSKLTAPPEVPGIPRPVWLTILGSVPTALGWYGYYKFSVEEELYQYELQTGKQITGCGGYGTLFPFVYGIIIGFPLKLLHVPFGDTIVTMAGLWILIGQANLYRRVNELCNEDGEVKKMMGLEEPPLHGWWALLPPPLDVVVGLRQVHFLSEYWRFKRGEEYDKDIIAEELFPFISSERFTLKEFVTEPKRWFWFTKNMEDFEILK